MKKFILPIMVVIAAAILCNGEITVVPPSSGGGGTDNTKVATNNGTAWGLTLHDPTTNVDLTANTLLYLDSNKVEKSATAGASVSLSGGTWNTIQNIRTSDSPQFGGATLTGTLNATGMTNNGPTTGTTITLAYTGGTNVVVDVTQGDYFNLLMTNTTWLIISNMNYGKWFSICILTNGTSYTLSYSSTKATSHIQTNSSITTITNETVLAGRSSYYGTNANMYLQAGFQ